MVGRALIGVVLPQSSSVMVDVGATIIECKSGMRDRRKVAGFVRHDFLHHIGMSHFPSARSGVHLEIIRRVTVKAAIKGRN